MDTLEHCNSFCEMIERLFVHSAVAIENQRVKI